MKKAMVTGASEGIGHAIARRLAKEGYQVTGVARNAEKLGELVRNLGTGHDSLVADLASEAGQTIVTNALQSGHYDLLVNNAGVGTSGNFMDVDMERQTALLRLNCEALARLSHAFLKQAREGDALVNISSVLSFVPLPGLGIYSASKSFVTAFSQALWAEQRRRGVYVAALHPGLTKTDFQAHAGGSTNGRPMGMAQTPEQVADTLIHALKSRTKPVVISGFMNWISSNIPRLLSARTVAALMDRVSKKL